MDGVQTMLLFALEASCPLGKRIAAAIGCPLARHEEREFDGGEHKARPLEEVGGRDVFVVQNLAGEPGNSANDKLVRLLFFIGALKDAGAARVAAVAPYLAYSRKNRLPKSRDPVSSRYLAAVLEAMELLPFRIERFKLDRATREETARLEQRLDTECARFGLRMRTAGEVLAVIPA
jgi:ribose-phosphate pyrophosphokinase